jgi:hypothetical protein
MPGIVDRVPTRPLITRSILRRVGYREDMSAEAVEPLRPRDYLDATPREVRAALIPEERADFDLSWRKALAEAAESLDLTGVQETLDSWRRVAMITVAHGHDAHRRMLRRAEHTTRTGELPPDAVPMEDIKAMVRERLGL